MDTIHHTSLGKANASVGTAREVARDVLNFLLPTQSGGITDSTHIARTGSDIMRKAFLALIAVVALGVTASSADARPFLRGGYYRPYYGGYYGGYYRPYYGAYYGGYYPYYGGYYGGLYPYGYYGYYW